MGVINPKDIINKLIAVTLDKEEPICKNDNMVDVSTIFSSFIKMSSNEILKNINSDNISDIEKFKIVSEQIMSIFDDININWKESEYVELFSDIKFLSYLEKYVRENIIYISKNVLFIKILNRIAFNYIIMSNLEDCNNIVLSLYENIIKTIVKFNNPNIIYHLMEYTSDEKLSLYLLIAKENVYDNTYIDNINYILMKGNPIYLTIENIINIYSELRCDVQSLFIRTMFGVYEQEQLNCISKNASLIYSNISNAVLNILQHQNMNAICNILVRFTNEYFSGNYRIRFSLNSISTGDYDRIYSAINIVNQGFKTSNYSFDYFKFVP